MQEGQSPCRTSFRSLARVARGLTLAAALATLVTAAPRADVLANTCNSRSTLSYPGAPNFAQVGDELRVRMVIGAGDIQGGTTLTVYKVRFELDCQAGDLGLNCVDEGAIVSYQGNLTTTCPTTIAASHAAGDAFPNQVVFTPATPIVIPINTDPFCAIEFDARIEVAPSDATPGVIEQVSGFSASQNDGVCNTVPTLTAGNTSSGSIQMCGDCDDGNVCTDDVCNRNTGCQHINNTDPCSDGNFCTTNDTCAAGSCVGGPPLICIDDNVCTDNVCDPAVGCVTTPNTDPCSDGNECTVADTCEAGLCIPGEVRDCNDGNICTTDSCDPATGCVTTPNTLPCDDFNACTTGDTCTGGACKGGPPPVCEDNNGCTDNECDPATGCVYPPNTDPCSDGNACTVGDVCVDGACVPGGEPKYCDDSDACTTDGCDPTTGCTHVGFTCDDKDVCTADSCDRVLGCVYEPRGTECDDGNECTTDACDAVSGCSHTLIDCNDHNKCTNDRCDPATGCVNAPVECGDSNACTDDACDPASGCSHTTINCSDQNKCTNDSCDPATGCVFADVTCGDGNACTDDACDPASGCSHTTIDCGDGNACTNDTCDPTLGCQYQDLVCDDDNFCTDDSCSTGGGCVFTPNSNPCDDSSLCNGREICTAGQCRRGAPLNCDDNDPCTDDCCDSDAGCSHAEIDSCNALAAIGCTLTAGAISPSGSVDPNLMAGTGTVTFGGQIAAITGVVSTADVLDQIQGYWRAQRQKKGSLNALDYTSMACGCDGVFNGTLCPGVDQTPGTVLSPASMVCFSGVADYSGGKQRRPKRVAFRIEVEDRGMPGTGPNGVNPGDIYRMRIWVPRASETADGLAGRVACPVLNPEQTVRPATYTDAGSLTSGDITIRPAAGAGD